MPFRDLVNHIEPAMRTDLSKKLMVVLSAWTLDRVRLGSYCQWMVIAKMVSKYSTKLAMDARTVTGQTVTASSDA